MDPSSPYCPKCGGFNQPDAVTCFACGEALPAIGSISQTVGTTATLVEVGPLKPGYVLRQRYRVLSRIGEGGFGAVYKAEDTSLGNRKVAIKEMSQRGLQSQELQEAKEAFHREALLLAGLAHPSLPRIYEHFSEGGNWYLVMDFIEGETLEDYLENHDGHVSVMEALQLGIKLCRVLEYLHGRQPPIIFRDLKPANIMLEQSGQVYLVDFGIARHFKPGQTHDTIAFGSPGYAAPEQYGKAQTTPRSDVYSLGALLHQLLSGHDPSDVPFRFAPLTAPAPVGTWELIQRMTDLDESRRPETMAVVRQELERLADAWADRQHTTSLSTGSLSQSTGAYPAAASARLSPPIQPVAAQTPPAYPPMPWTGTGVQSGSKKKSRWRYLWIIIPCFFLLRAVLGNSSSYSSTTTDTSSNPPGSYFGSVNDASWSPDGKYIAEAVGQGVEVRDISTGVVIQTYQADSSGTDWLAWSPDSTRIASANNDGTANVWAVKDGTTIATFKGQMRRVSELSWSPDGTKVVSSSDDGTVQVWDASTGSILFTYREHTDMVWTVAWSPNGKYIASGGEDETVRVWDAATGKTLIVYHGQSGGIGHLSWSPDSANIASASEDGTVHVWNAATGTTLSTYSEHTSNANALAWSPDGKYIVSASTDLTVDVWSVEPLQTIFVYHDDVGTVESVAWSPDGNRIAVAGEDGTVHIWDALTGNNEVVYQEQS
jgi:WD40 repeat protein/tRNA A-37 threonylcarbamoyl transferase component Bud32